MSKTRKSALDPTVVTMRAISFTPMCSASAFADLSASEQVHFINHSEVEQISC